MPHPAKVDKARGRRDYDVIIFGGGPAGAATALASAQKGLTAAVLTKGRHPGPAVGETVSPSIMRPLSRLGVWQTFIAAGHAVAPGTVAIWGDPRPYENDFIYDPYGPGWHLDRVRFDTMLLDAARRAGADIYDAPIVSCIRTDNGGLNISLSSTIAELLRARVVVDATGRTAWFARRQTAARRRIDRLVALVKFAPTLSREPRTLIESCAEGWWYGAVLPEGQAAAAFFTDSDLLSRHVQKREQHWNELLARTKLISGVMPAVCGSPLHTVAACSGTLNRVSGENWLAIGDAAQTYDPLSGRGIEKALASALMGVEAILKAREGDQGAFDRFADKIEREFQDYRNARLAYYGRENRWADQMFWQRRHSPARPLSAPKGTSGQEHTDFSTRQI
jgi:flavin-dependent dehydrogenase